tara:strand:+ start:310 stop:483 length:174 start_codon:yes stop_codon:yes gene_type:complete
MDKNAKLRPTKQDLKKKPEKRFLKKIGAILDEPHPFNQIKDKKKSNIEKIFIKKKSN